MTLLNTATVIFLGGTPVERVYLGDELVWPAWAGTTVTASMVLKSGSTVTVSTVVTGDTPTLFKWYYSTNGDTWTFLFDKPTGAPFDYTTTYNTTIWMKAEVFYPPPAEKIVAFASPLTIGPAPPPVTTQKTVTLSPTFSMTYKENGTQNTFDGAGSTKFMSGRFDSTNGNQRSAFFFDIDRADGSRGKDMRWCVRIDKVELSVQNDHWYVGNGPVSQTIAITHTKRDPNSSDKAVSWATFPGCTGYFGGRSTYRDDWWGGGDTNTGRHWVDITNDRPASPSGFTDTVAEQFRVKGAQGIVLGTTSTAQGSYGYFLGNMQLRVTYTVNT